MENTRHIDNSVEKMRGYSSVFSSTSFAQLLLSDDYTFIKHKINRYDKENIGKKFTTYLDYLQYIYKQLQNNYRCEYIYKNTIINELLLKEYGTKSTVVFNEFKVGNSVADLVLFNGTSKAFEIKTELDSMKRLENQLCHYTKLFRQCYIVIHESLLDKYIGVDSMIGIIVIKAQSGRNLKLEEIRPALQNENIDAHMLMRSIRTPEYKNIAKAYYGTLPPMNSFNMFDICRDLLERIPADNLHHLFINELKKRKSNTSTLRQYKKELRQLCLSMNISLTDYQVLETKLNLPVKL